jgi:hypothetical protein
MCTALAVLLLIPPAAQRQAEIETALKPRIEAVLAAVGATDPEKALAGWPEKAPGREGFREVVERLQPGKGVTLKIGDTGYGRWRIGEKQLTLRVRFTVTSVDRDGIPGDRDAHAWTFRFVLTPEGWQWDHFSDSRVRVAEAVVAADREQALRIVRDNLDLPAAGFAKSLVDEAELAVRGGRPGAPAPRRPAPPHRSPLAPRRVPSATRTHRRSPPRPRTPPL